MAGTREVSQVTENRNSYGLKSLPLPHLPRSTIAPEASFRLASGLMNTGKRILIGGLFVGSGLAFAVKFGEKPNTPQLPGVPYVVHDGTRPQPRKVANKGAVTTPPPADAKILFDGTNTDAWTGGDWKIVDGAMVASGKSISTKEHFRDFQLHLEFRINKERYVNGQSGANSGVFLMGKYEIQVMSNFENKTYPDGQAGAMYGQFPPLVNASVPKGEWSSYDIIFTAPRYEGEKVTQPAKVTVLHNGIVVQNAQEFYGPTRHKKLTSYPAKHPEKGPISLQWHSDPMQYRNIWIREIGEYDQQ